jgi:hypothetical protein
MDIVTGSVLGEASYKRWSLPIPYCRPCNGRYWTRRLGLFSAVTLPGVAALCLLILANAREWPAPLRFIAFVLILLTFVSPLFWFLLRDAFSDVRILSVDTRDGCVALRIRNPAYAEELRRLNADPPPPMGKPLT